MSLQALLEEGAVRKGKMKGMNHIHSHQLDPVQWRFDLLWSCTAEQLDLPLMLSFGHIMLQTVCFSDLASLLNARP